ncbi:hypothetical protein BJV77DRAFT_1010617 [Russula vinacea]|nr:hypothetical protein BJV77DRAFT_1010617 [Russula vinacea]
MSRTRRYKNRNVSGPCYPGLFIIIISTYDLIRYSKPTELYLWEEWWSGQSNANAGLQRPDIRVGSISPYPLPNVPCPSIHSDHLALDAAYLVLTSREDTAPIGRFHLGQHVAALSLCVWRRLQHAYPAQWNSNQA